MHFLFRRGIFLKSFPVRIGLFFLTTAVFGLDFFAYSGPQWPPPRHHNQSRCPNNGLGFSFSMGEFFVEFLGMVDLELDYVISGLPLSPSLLLIRGALFFMLGDVANLQIIMIFKRMSSVILAF